MIEEKLKRVEFTYDDLLGKLYRNEPFAFARTGDGEILCMLSPSETGGNCDGHYYYKTLSDALLNVLKSKPKYHLGIQNHALRNHGSEIESFFDNHELWDLEWSSADILHHASINNELDKFFEALKNEAVILVAPLNLYELFEYKAIFIPVPEKNCWNDYSFVRTELMRCIAKRPIERNPIVLFCCSMMAGVLIDDMYKIFPKTILIDCGSLFSPYVGIANRSYHKKIIERLNG